MSLLATRASRRASWTARSGSQSAIIEEPPNQERSHGDNVAIRLRIRRGRVEKVGIPSRYQRDKRYRNRR